MRARLHLSRVPIHINPSMDRLMGPAGRWAIVACVRELERKRLTTPTDVPARIN
jgi:hypothetical protein